MYGQPAPVLEGATGVKPVAARAPPKPRLMSGRKPAGKTGGLGVKKMSKQVDESHFDQAPEEQAPARSAVSLPCTLKKLTLHMVWQTIGIRRSICIFRA